MKRINRNLYPVGGYFFINQDGSKIVGEKWPDVVVRVADYRKRNNLPPGNPDAEVDAQACERTPAYCSEENMTVPPMTAPATLKSRVLAWLSGTLRGQTEKPLQFVNDATALERERICAGCPRNKSLPEGCATCKAAVKEYRKAIIGSRRVNGRLNACEVLGEDLPASVHIDEPRVENSDLPDNCWRKRTL